MTDELEEGQLKLLAEKHKQLIKDWYSYRSNGNVNFHFPSSTNEVPDFIYDFIATKDYTKLETDIRDELTPDNYISKFMTLLNLEEAFRAIEVHHLLDRGEVELVATDFNTLSMSRPQVDGKSLGKGDAVILRHKSSFAGYGTAKLDGENIRIERKSRQFPRINGIYDVVWVRYDKTLYHCSNALKHIENVTSIWTTLLPIGDELYGPISIDKSNLDAVECMLDDLDDHQKGAVCNITSDVAQKAPYIIYGPSGTGKTRALIESIMQVHRSHPESRLLVCAITNKCVDDLVFKILNSGMINDNYIVRVKSGRRHYSLSGILDRVTKVCQLNDKCHHDHRIVITTFGTAAKAAIKFDYAFLDEAHRFSEPEALVIMSKLYEGGRFVMAGDPQQPGPVCIYPVARDHGLGKSMLERLCQSQAYQGSYGSAICTKLTTCYRSDPRLMALNNELFYDNKLKCLATTPQKYLDMLDVSSPLIYEKVAIATEEQNPISLGWFNEEEVEICSRYIRLLHSNGIDVEKQVGIISPYKAQVEKISEALEREQLPRCKVDSVKKFSGEERDIMLISAVRTSVDPDCEFLFDPKHFNVASSRAKFVLIVVGHEETLKNSPCWTKFIKRAERPLTNNALLYPAQPMK